MVNAVPSASGTAPANGASANAAAAAPPLNVAVVGSGVAGLAAAWLLNQYPERFRVTLYEQADYLGGHTHTVEVPPLKEYQANTRVHPVPVDTGFIVLNPCTYPNFLRFLDQLNVPLTNSDMSFAVSRDRGVFEWAGDTLSTVFAQRKNLLDFSRDGMWVMLWDVLRFHWIAADIADAADQVSFKPESATDTAKALYAKYKTMSIGDFLAEGNYSPSFKDNFLVPQTAAIWSTPAGTCMEEFPILTLISFFRNHRMLQLVGRPRWLTVALGAREYVSRIAEKLPDVRVSTGVQSITRNAKPTIDAHGIPRGTVTVVDEHRTSAKYDHVILATHGDTSRALIRDLTPAERTVLDKVRYTPNRAVLHRDPALMPVTRSAWSSWNYLTRTDGGSDETAVCVTYWMNRLQPFIPRTTHGDVFLTINPLYEPDPALVIDEYSYDHPVYGFDLVRAQEEIASVANINGIGFAGAWLNYCFHEDGCTAGLAAAAALGATPPFPLTLNGGYPTHRRAFAPVPTFPLVPSRDTYLRTMARVLPHDYLKANPEAQKLAARPLPRSVDHTTEMSLFEVAAGLVPIILGAVMPDSVKQRVPAPLAALLLPANAGKARRMITSTNGGTVPVPALAPRDAIGLAAPVRVLELAERWGLAIALVFIGVPIVTLLWLLGLVQIVDGLSGGKDKKEAVWVNPRVRVVWK